MQSSSVINKYRHIFALRQVNKCRQIIRSLRQDQVSQQQVTNIYVKNTNLFTNSGSYQDTANASTHTPP